MKKKETKIFFEQKNQFFLTELKILERNITSDSKLFYEVIFQILKQRGKILFEYKNDRDQTSFQFWGLKIISLRAFHWEDPKLYFSEEKFDFDGKFCILKFSWKLVKFRLSLEKFSGDLNFLKLLCQYNWKNNKKVLDKFIRKRKKTLSKISDH